MKTLKELFDEHGSVWLALKDWPNEKSFFPIGYALDFGIIVGILDNFKPIQTKGIGISYDGFILYQEPKKKVVRYLYAVRTVSDGWTLRPYFLEDGEAVSKYMKTDCVEIKRLDYTATEFEE